MAIGTDQQQPGKRVVLQDDLVNDATAWFPETDSIFRAGRGEKVVDLFVDILQVNGDERNQKRTKSCALLN